ncbi:F-box only protein 4 isoform X2 [Poeciliopsis prolifica]|uniref:F-box only protein 4 isoform X2 n=1 Tax=Poeciliopsis prolifica TaxID=188132 RepID=UPI002412FA84|nr:F-box only protein 4 isoform X2 [Poeciliopsis prolifica]
MAERDGHLKSVVIRSFRRFSERYFPEKPARSSTLDEEQEEEASHWGYLDSFPADVQFLIMTFLSPVDICNLGATCRYWRAMVRDPLLWKYFLLRDMPHWSSIDHLTMPDLELLDAPLVSELESLDDRKEDEEKNRELKCDYMSEQQWLPSRPAHQLLTLLLQYLVPSSEPRYAMFGPGMEQLDVSLVTRLMHAPDLLPVAGTPHRQINGIGSGISYLFNNQHKFNILTLYSTNRAEREKARLQQQSISNKLFTFEGTDDAGCPVYTPAPQVQKVCLEVDGFIYVANAEPGKGDGVTEAAQIRAVLNFVGDSTAKPLLVLSCVSREPEEASEEAKCRTPCVYVAKSLGLPQLSNRWMVQDTVAESLTGVLDGIAWLLKSSGVKM